MQNARDQLPDFGYHPDPIGTGSISATPVTCACCGQQRPFSYTGPVYATEELDNELCPWCIADGRAAAMFDAQFTDVTWRVPEDVPEDVTEEILTRTPGFAGWQQEHWMHHCSDAADYHGTAGAPELAAFPDAMDWVRRQAEAYRPKTRSMTTCEHCARTGMQPPTCSAAGTAEPISRTRIS